MSVKQYRLDYAPRALEVSVSNESPEPIFVTRASFDSPLFDGTSAWTRRTEVPAGATRDLRVMLGTPVCDPPGAVRAPVVGIEFETADGTAGSGSAEPADQFDTVAKVTAQDCIAEHTSQIAEITAGDALRTEQRAGELVALLDLTARPTGTQGVAHVATAARTTLLGPADRSTGWDLGWAASAASGTLTTSLAIVPSNCNPHIVAEDKRGTYFPLDVTLDDGEAGTVYVGVTDAVREQLYAYVGTYCGW
ncbi:hypothetical protein GCM10027413_31280 [Conyzicola nivalis]|uniref:Uncharacterized protein n=1 Tax=Conyzicola nivalis TaxID=1477021 RepID=A0A916SR03_9MICO|nr:hypothetical protein [Conyzicola nivalis]GGB12253.1 hypothetical protein GCM10010979_28240 [Conyzicola nivalis]